MYHEYSRGLFRQIPTNIGPNQCFTESPKYSIKIVNNKLRNYLIKSEVFIFTPSSKILFTNGVRVHRTAIKCIASASYLATNGQDFMLETPGGDSLKAVVIYIT